MYKNKGERVYELFEEIRDLLKEIRDLLSGQATPAISPGEWVEKSSPEDVTIDPGNKEVVLEVKGSGYLWEIGVNDETYSTYYLIVDGTQVGEPQPQPWGLYNSPYRFPKPIEFSRYVEVIVERHEDAPASADYYAKVRYEKR